MEEKGASRISHKTINIQVPINYRVMKIDGRVKRTYYDIIWDFTYDGPYH